MKNFTKIDVEFIEIQSRDILTSSTDCKEGKYKTEICSGMEITSPF